MNRVSPSNPGSRLPLEPMDARIRDIQPGGGVIIHLERMWGHWRRWWLTRFRKRYVDRMRASRQGDPSGVPHEVLDPRDLKLYRNQTDCHWAEEDDPFTWRNRLPFARVGLAELMVFSLMFWTLAGTCSVAAFAVTHVAVRIVLGLLAVTFGLFGIEILWFFRNPVRQIPNGVDDVVAPADGKVVRIERIENEFIGGQAIEIGIFLSVFNVHINRMPVASRVVGIQYQPGKYLNALRPESDRENEQLAIRLEQIEPTYRRMVVRQITGAIARRIVCWLKPGDELQRGEQLGMIKLGSRTVLVIPDEDGLEIACNVGDKVKAGSSILARYHPTNDRSGS